MFRISKIKEEVKKAKKSIKRNVVNNELKLINQKLDKLSSNLGDVMEGMEFLMERVKPQGTPLTINSPGAGGHVGTKHINYHWSGGC